MDKSSSGKEMVKFGTRLCIYCGHEIKRGERYEANNTLWLARNYWHYIHEDCLSMKRIVDDDKVPSLVRMFLNIFRRRK